MCSRRVLPAEPELDSRREDRFTHLLGRPVRQGRLLRAGVGRAWRDERIQLLKEAL